MDPVQAAEATDQGDALAQFSECPRPATMIRLTSLSRVVKTFTTI
jgi:hypothetical protein